MSDLSDLLKTTQEHEVAHALHCLLSALPPNLELLFYRDDDAPAVLEVHYPNGTTEVATLASPAGAVVQIIETLDSDTTHAAWRPLTAGLPAPLTDVLLLQVLAGFAPEEGHTLVRIGFRRLDGSWLSTYCVDSDGHEETIDGVTHWAPLPAEPLAVQS